MDISAVELLDEFDALALTGGSEKARELDVPGCDLGGIHSAMDFLTQQNRSIVDTLNCSVTVGPKWEAAEPVSDPVLWADADSGNDSAGEKCESLIWIDIFSNDDPLDCP